MASLIGGAVGGVVNRPSFDYLGSFPILTNDAALLTVLEIAALWCGVTEEDLEYCVRDIEHSYGNDEYWHCNIPGIQHATRAIITAIKNKELIPVNYSECAEEDINGRVAIDFSHMMFTRKEIGEWILKKYPRTPAPFFQQSMGTTEESTAYTTQKQPYTPRYKNPAIEVLLEISREIWDKVEEGVKPPKALKIKEKIAIKLEEKIGVKHNADTNLVKQIDAIARPPKFKGKS